MTRSIPPLPPRPRELPLIGHSWQLAVDSPRFIERQYSKFGPVSRFVAMGRQWVLAAGAEACQAILSDETGAYVAGPAWEAVVGPSLQRGLSLLDANRHLKDRHILTRAFTTERLDAYLKAMNDVVIRELQEWRPGARFRAQDGLWTVTLRTLVRVFMGGGLGSQAPEVDKALAASAAATRMIVRLPIPGSAWSRALAGRRLLEDLFRERIPIMRLRGGSDLFAVLCRISEDEDSHLTDDDVVNHMIFFLVAGYNPLTFTMATMMRFLAEHPEWQEQCRSESFAVATEEPDRDDLDKLVSLDLVLKESLRLVPPLPLIPRWTTRDVELLGYRVPRGTPMLLSLYTAQRSPEFWSNPEQFDPERFAAHRREDLAHPYAWMPFGADVHRCIGERFTSLQAKLTLYHVLRRFRWKLAADYRPSIKWRGLPSMNRGMPVHLERVD